MEYNLKGYLRAHKINHDFLFTHAIVTQLVQIIPKVIHFAWDTAITKNSPNKLKFHILRDVRWY